MNIKIGRLTWKVRMWPDGNENLKLHDGTDCFGVTNYAALQINLLEEHPSAALFRQTVIHELVHAFAFSFGVHLLANEETEEPICDFMGAHLDEIYCLANKIVERMWKKC